MRPRQPIPPELRGLAIRTSESQIFGVGRSRTRRSDVAHPFHGVSGVELRLDSIRARCRAFEPLLLPDQVFSHTTALALLGAPLPEHLEDQLHVSVLFPRTPPRGRGVHGHSLRRLPHTLLAGLPVSAPAAAWAQAASLLRREDLVAVGDFLVTGRRRAGTRDPGLVMHDELVKSAIEHRGSPGARRMAWALARIRSGVDSRPETYLRLLLMGAGLTSVVVDHPIPVVGGLVLHADLAFVPERIALEYEGDDHRVNRKTWTRDIRRRELMEDAGWRVIRVTFEDVFLDSANLLARIRFNLRTRRASWS